MIKKGFILWKVLGGLQTDKTYQSDKGLNKGLKGVGSGLGCDVA